VPARRAVVRWAWRLFRREWRQQVLIVVLLTFAVAACIVSASVAFNVAPAHAKADFGSANHFFVFDKPDPSTLPAKLDAATQYFGQIDAIGHRTVAMPGTTKNVDYRVQDPGGPFGGPLLDLRSGRYPSSASEVAITDWIASTLSIGVGSVLNLDGVERTVVGLVENPSDLRDEFALLAPTDFTASDSVTMLVDASEGKIQGFRPPGDHSRIIAARGDIPEDVAAAIGILVVGTVAMFLVALVATASFVVIAQRRLPQLGMLSAVGATQKQVRMTMLANGMATGLVAALLGAIGGLGGWFAIAPSMEGAVGARIDPMNVPWWLIISGMFLAIATATGAAWWPARTMSRIPTVMALSGRPPRPTPIRRSALLSAAVIAAGIACLTIASHTGGHNGVSLTNAALVLVGTLAVVAGVLLIGPLAIRALALVATRVPIAARLALRDLSRYQARSGAALAAISLALGIPVALVATAAAAENHVGAGNLPNTQLIASFVDVDGPFLPDPAAIPKLQEGVDQIVVSLGNATGLRLDAAKDPKAEPDKGTSGQPAISIGRRVKDGLNEVSLVYVATPQLLPKYGLGVNDLGTGVDVLTAETGDLRLISQAPQRSGGLDDFERVVSPGTLDRTYTSLPGALISMARLQQRGWEAVASGRWLIETTKPLTGAQLATSREIAFRYGLKIETRDYQTGLANLRLGATAVGMLVALSVLAATVGLIRSEAAGDLRTLTAAGAPRRARRTITATTAGGLAMLGVVLGIVGAYVGLVAGRLSDLAPLPLTDLAAIAIGTPLAAAGLGWLFAGREPAALSRAPLD
jgi:putative ABC transport system permease protein